jgi:hypothetical protein
VDVANKRSSPVKEERIGEKYLATHRNIFMGIIPIIMFL